MDAGYNNNGSISVMGMLSLFGGWVSIATQTPWLR